MLKQVRTVGILLAITMAILSTAQPSVAENLISNGVPPAELEKARLAEIVAGIDLLLTQVDTASRSGVSGRIQFNYGALKRDLLGRRELIQRYINGSWDVPRDIAPMASTYNR